MSEKNVLLAVVSGLVFSGILACTMSTADSQLLAAAEKEITDEFEAVQADMKG